MREFNNIFRVATQRIQRPYFQLPLAGSEEPIYRERVYCYELYHQMRSMWPENCRYTLSGEVDKSGHPLIRDNGLDGLKPDFLIHIPGDMEHNFSVIEVKPVTALVDGFLKDINTLNAFMRFARYDRGLLLIYGGGLEQMSKKVADLVSQDLECEVWIHEGPGMPAEKYQ